MILEIFKNDLKNLSKSTMAIIVVVGIIIIPGIYAWLNIGSNWNPYSNTGNIPIAVVNQDEGAAIAGEDFNIGNNIVDSLKERDLNSGASYQYTRNFSDSGNDKRFVRRSLHIAGSDHYLWCHHHPKRFQPETHHYS